MDDLTDRVDAVKEENLKLRSENSVLGQYIENLMQASAVFQQQPGAADPSAAACKRSEKRPASMTSLGSVIRSYTAKVNSAKSANACANASAVEKKKS